MPNIDFFGMFCLGAYMGGIANYGLLKIREGDDFRKTLVVIVASLFAGSVFVFIEKLIPPEEKSGIRIAIFMYPVGLLNAILWLQVIHTVNHYLNAEKKILKLLAYLHITAVTGFSAWSIAQCF
jgi:hypothetical protein